MPQDRHRRPLLPCPDPGLLIQITDDGSRTLLERASGNTFHSSAGAMTETDHVYLSNSGVAERLEQQQPTRVLEVGLGTGLGMLMTVERAVSCGAGLSFESLETHWLSAEIVGQLELEQTVDKSLVQRYLQFRRSQQAIVDQHYGWSPGNFISVTIHLQPAQDWLPRPGQQFDAIYFDPFAPDAAPDLWTVPIFSKLKTCLAKDGKIVTYCVSRQVRDRFVEAGMRPRVVKGPPGGKRNSLIVEHDSSLDHVSD